MTQETKRPEQPPGAIRRAGSGVARNLNKMLCAVSLVVAIAAGAGYLWLSYQAQAQAAEWVAHTDAALLTRALRNSPDWKRDAARWLDAAAPAADDLAQALAIHDAAGTVVAIRTIDLEAPTLTRTVPVVGASGPLGELSVSRSMSPFLSEMLAVMLFAAALVALPVVALRRQLSVLRRDAVKAGLETEERLRIVFEHSIEGFLTFLPDGKILSCNPAAGRIFKQAPAALIGRNLTELVRASAGSHAARPFRNGLYEAVGRRHGGAEFPVEITVSETLFTGETQMIVIIRDITERKETQDRLAFLANYDSLTGLPNRVLFRDRLGEAMKRAKRSGSVMGLMFLDLDRFKLVNDSLGHEVGDQLLRHVSETLTNCLRSVDTVGHKAAQDTFTVSRLGGDEFTVIIENIGGAEDAAMVAKRILDALDEPFISGTKEVYISASIGISLYPHDNTDLDGLIRHTDMAMYRSKAMGRGTYSFFCTDMTEEVAARLSMEASLRHALERNEFVIHYQPKADLRTGVVTGVEALIRWNRPEEGMVAPDRFISMLEETGLILPVGAWVIRTACAELASWDRLGLPPLTLAVNLSTRQFRLHYLSQLVADTLLETGIAPHRLELELTESLLMEDNEASRGVLASLAKMGVRIAIDDFGTGHSSLSYLKRLRINTIKIDRSFVRDIPGDPEDSAIATAIVALGQSLQLKVVAEGVETSEQAEFLRKLGCDEAQGYLLSRPLPPAQLITWLDNYGLARNPLTGRPSRADTSPITLLTFQDSALLN